MDLDKLNQLLSDYRQDPGRLVWGEIFYLFHCAKKSREPLYTLNPAGDIIYDHTKRRFIIRVPDMQIYMKDDELVDAIVYKGLFHPKKT